MHNKIWYTIELSHEIYQGKATNLQILTIDLTSLGRYALVSNFPVVSGIKTYFASLY